jgi:hypothetical protein
VNLSTAEVDLGNWERLIKDAVCEADPILSNLKITRCHYLLSTALQQLLGVDAGANFHSWAVWGSRKAGVTIRQEDLDEARRDGTVAGAVVGCLVGLALGWLMLNRVHWLIFPGLGLFGGLCGALTGCLIIVRSRQVSSRLILEGNRTVLEDIGLQTARFLCCFHAQCAPDHESLANFLAGLRPGDTSTGGQELLRRAFVQYYAARFASDSKAKQESTYLANCLAVYHEHIRLERYIRGSMPWIVRRCVTKRLLQYDIGPVRLAVAHDVPAIDGIPFPESLRSLKNQELVEFLTRLIGCQLDTPPLKGTGARDWTNIRERMRYVVNLFRSMHLDGVVFDVPYNSDQMAAIAAGSVPARPL